MASSPLKALASAGHILIRGVNLKTVLLTRTYHSADCDTDHSLVCYKIRLQSKKLRLWEMQLSPGVHSENSLCNHWAEGLQEQRLV